LKLRAMFDNSKLELFPNQFVNAHLILETLRNQIVVPGAALQNGSQGTYVYLVNADNTVSMRPVVTGPTAGDVVAITKGLSSGQTVVVDGADQLRDGAKITLPGAAAPGSSSGAHPWRNGASSGGSAYGHPGGSSSSGGDGSSGSSGGQHHRHGQNGGDGISAPAGAGPPPA